MSVKYLTDHVSDVTFIKQPVRKRGHLHPGQSQEGYGKKIALDYMAVFNGRKHRVYCCIHSNVGTCYVLIKKEWHVVRDYDIPDEIRNI